MYGVNKKLHFQNVAKPVSIPTTPTTTSNENSISKNKILEKIMELAEYKRYEEFPISEKADENNDLKGQTSKGQGQAKSRMCWVVKRDVLEEQKLTDIQVKIY